MATKFVIFFTLLAIANAGVLSPVRYTATPVVAYANPAVDAVASTHQNVVRSFGGTVSTHSKAIDTPYSSVRKTDTRINNNVYTPAIAKTIRIAASAPVYEKHDITYAAPAAVTKTVSYAAPVIEKTATAYAAPVPAVTKTVYAHAVAPAAVYAQPASAVVSHPPNADFYTPTIPKPVVAYTAPAKPIATYAAATPIATTSYNHGPSATTYAHNAPGVSGYGSSQTVHYSPAEMVSHMSFDGFGTHWGY